MAIINGSFSGISPSYIMPYIDWSYSQDIAGNWTDITANLYFTRVNTAYYGFNYNTHSCTYNIDGNSGTNGDQDFDITGATVTQLVRSVTVRVYHASDGTKTAYIGFSGNPNVGWGTYNFGQTVSLPTIPREATVSNSVNFTVENDIPLTISNPGNMYVKSELYVNGTLIKSTNHGQNTSVTITLDGTDDGNIYDEMPNTTSVAMFVRLKTYTSSGYSTQIGSNKDKAGTASINTTTNKPTFTTYALSNVDKNIEVKDKYDNLLITSSTEDLVDSSTKIIKGYSKVRATISEANKAIAFNSATMSKYRLVNAIQQVEALYAPTGDVTLDIDNITTNNFTVTAFDSRSLTTAVANSFGFMADYSNLLIFDVHLIRDNGVDSNTKLQFAGQMFDGYFGGGTSGVQNEITVEYRYKETTVSWGAQTWNDITADVNVVSGEISFDEYIDGDLGASGFDTELSFDIEVRAYDKLSQMIVEVTLNVGTPLIDFTKEGISLGARYDEAEGGLLQINGVDIVNSIMEKIYPIGRLIIDADDLGNPGTYLSFGTWTEFAAGKTLVSYSSGETEFDSVGETGGQKTVALSSAQNGTHAHTQNSHNHQTYKTWGLNAGGGSASFVSGEAADGYSGSGNYTNSTTSTEQNSGSGTAHNNLPPYIVVKMWKRTA